MIQPPKESEVQATIVAALKLAGLEVMHTSAFRQKGPSGVSKGIPDLLVRHPGLSHCLIGIEVKRPGKITYSSQEQRRNHALGHFEIAQTPEQALQIVYDVLKASVCEARDFDKVKRTLDAFRRAA